MLLAVRSRDYEPLVDGELRDKAGDAAGERHLARVQHRSDRSRFYVRQLRDMKLRRPSRHWCRSKARREAPCVPPR
jgi:hypothetical protein